MIKLIERTDIGRGIDNASTEPMTQCTLEVDGFLLVYHIPTTQAQTDAVLPAKRIEKMKVKLLVIS